LEVSGIRPPFFIVEFSPEHLRLTKNKTVFSAEGIELGRFRIVDISGDRVLCKCDGDQSDLKKMCYVNVVEISEKQKGKTSKPAFPEPQDRKIFLPEIIKVQGIRFIERSEGLFITENPIPASIVKDLSFTGIENFMKKIGNEYGNSEVGYLNISEMKKYLKPEIGVMMLGVRDGLPVIVFPADAGSAVNPVSKKILTKLKYEIYIPLKLKRSQ